MLLRESARKEHAVTLKAEGRDRQGERQGKEEMTDLAVRAS